MIGRTLSHYRILEQLGAGGMGVVYLAHDERLDRDVAVKVLPADALADEAARRRFRKEALTLSQLNHPNIAVVHDFDTQDGVDFLAMEFVAGETLAHELNAGALPEKEVVKVGVQIAEALEEAHERDLIHRDLKPGNVMVTPKGRVKVLDFGLAKLMRPLEKDGATASLAETQAGAVMGTVPYMAPEQLQGEAVDARADLYALGAILYEMGTGQRPFPETQTPRLISAIMGRPPQAPRQLNGQISLGLEALILKALEKDPARRYQSAKDMLVELRELSLTGLTTIARRRALTRRWALAASLVALLAILVGLSFFTSVRERIAYRLFARPEEHVAVLPFDNIGNNPANQALAEGLVDNLTSKFSNLDVGQQSLWVVPASEVRRRMINDPTAAFKELGATLVVTGSVERDEQGVHLMVNLINAKTLRQMGSVTLEDRAGDLSALLDEAVARLARLMHVEVSPEALRSAGGSGTPAAYESYLKALGYMQRYDKSGNLDLAISALSSAVKTDPRFALGFAGLGEAYRLKHQLDRNPKWTDEALANCQRAAELDDRLPAVYVTLGHIHSGLGKADLALQEFQRALQLNSRDADALSGLAGAYEKMGRKAEAEATYQRAAAMRPDYWDGYNSLALLYDRLGRYQDAITQIRRAAELSPDNAQVYSNMGAFYLDMEDPKVLPDAEKALRKSIELGPGYPAYANLGFLYMQQKRYAECAAMTEKALEFNDKDFRVWANLALAYKWLQRNDKAAAAAEKELQLLEVLVKVEPNEPTVQTALGDLYAEKKLREKALTRVQAALALAPDDPNVLADAAEAYEDLGDRRQALQFIEKALQKGYSLEALRRVFGLQKLLSDPNFHQAAR